MMNSRLISRAMVGILVMTMFVGCKGDDVDIAGEHKESAKQEVTHTGQLQKELAEVSFPLEEAVTFSVFGVINKGVPLDECKAFQVIAKNTNIEFDVQSVDRRSVNEKRNILLSTNQYPDLFVKGALDRNTVDRYAKQGVFVPLDDLLENYAPNIMGIFEEYPDIQEALKSADGQIYALGSFASKKGVMLTPLWINEKWMENLDLDEPKNIDDLYDILLAFAREDANGNGDPNDEIAFSVAATNSVFKNILPYFGRSIDKLTDCSPKDGKLELAMVTDEYKQMLIFLNNLYKEGALDERSFTQTVAQAYALGTGGDIIGTTLAYAPQTIVSRDKGQNYGILPAFYPDTFYAKDNVNYGAFVMTDKCEHPEIAIAWIDQFYSDEGRLLGAVGIEGESFRYIDDTKTKYEWIVPEGMNLEEFKAKYSITGTAYSPSMAPKHLVKTDLLDRHVGSQKSKFVERYCHEIFPHLFFTDEEVDTIQSIRADIDSYMNQYEVQVITGQVDIESTWEDYKKTLNNKGLEQLMTIYNSAYTKAMQLEK